MPGVVGQDSPPSLLANCLLIKYSSLLMYSYSSSPFSRVCALISLISGRQNCSRDHHVIMCVKYRAKR